ncbi:thioredoxin-like protein [Nadsonia fulvescens var. elongata DSM 6958]|uniref:Thioredoxin-like protein n=1 Tax=Nadsonia fulvescens var. elongata DSM 6958 TaxID=857566 RepID=A0A1E3PIG5_9ASCO|nr:thioredoxin-like protein [Nadsonia fulvescens var. elongata DSM 6958]
MAIQTISSLEEFTRSITSQKHVVIDFYAEWCGPCKAIAPLLQQLEDQYARQGVAFIKINVDTEATRTIVQSFEVTAMPTFVFLTNQQEVKRVKGANTSELKAAVAQLVANTATSATESTESTESTDAVITQEIDSFIPTAYEVLNSGINFSESEALNVAADSASLKQLFSLTAASGEVKYFKSDTDSQLLCFVPLLNKCKVHSLLIKRAAELPYSNEDDLQHPSQIKVFSNSPGMISFDDVNSNSLKPLHDSVVTFEGDSLWAEIKLRFVKFQNVNSLVLFIDGEDEDALTVLDRIVIVGVNGESRQHAKIEKLEE